MFIRLGKGHVAADWARRLRHRPGFVWLDGDAQFGAAGRFSFLGSDPVESHAVQEGGDLKGVFDAIENEGRALWDVPAWLKPHEVPLWIGYVAYDALWSLPDIAHVVPRKKRPGALPVMVWARYKAVIAMDHMAGEAACIGESEAACKELLEHLECGAAQTLENGLLPYATAAQVSAKEAHLVAVENALESIGEGKFYQVNLARRWAAPFFRDSFDLWMLMRKKSPVPLGAYIALENGAILSRSMERFLRWERTQNRLWTSPIKGTVARSGESDAKEARSLQSDPKEHAEHVMIVDLMRNDLGRVANAGKLVVEDWLRVEPYANLLHLVSTIRCETQAGLSLYELFCATFPPGSVTGTPKIAAVRAIETLEPFARGLYTGAIGFIDGTGGLSLSVAIRTAVIQDGEILYHAGGGIVADSDPAKELAETELKAHFFLDALQNSFA